MPEENADIADSASPGWEPPPPEEVARLFPNYEVLGLIGRSEMGAVYQARQTALDRLVAIKLVPPKISADEDFAERFRKEARAMARLNHPNIVAVYDFGTTSARHLFIVMDYVEGPTLHDIIHRPAEAVAGITDPGYFLAPDQALSIVEQVCVALGYAHARGIVHRRLQPGKVMIDTEGQVKVSDFGLSPPSTGADPGAAAVDRPGYRAPEQVHGQGVDRRTDVYRLGVMLYEMLCREVPAEAFEATSARIGCDTRIDAIVLRAIQQAPERRYQSAQEMQSAVAAARVPVPVPLPQMAAAPVPNAPEKSNLQLYAMMTLVVAALAWAYVHFAKPVGKGTLAETEIPAQTSPGNSAETNLAPGATSGGNGAETGVISGDRADARGARTVEKASGDGREAQGDKALATGESPRTAEPGTSLQPRNAMEKWLADVDGPQHAAFQKLVAEPFATGVEKLRTRYLAALDAGQARAAATGVLNQALVWHDERELFEKAQTVWPDDENTPAPIRPLRADYRQRLAQLESERANRVKPLYASYDAILLHNLTLLTQRGRIDDAQLLKQKREEIARTWLETPITGHLPKEQPALNSELAPETLTYIEDLAASSARNPDDTMLAMKLATLQMWFGRNADYAATCDRWLERAAKTGDANTAERIAKIACLKPNAKPSVREAALALAARSVELGQGDNEMPFFKMVLGMAEFRSGGYAEAEKALSVAIVTNASVGKTMGNFVECTAGFFKAMSLFKQGRQAEARKIFAASESEMTPLPADEKDPLGEINFLSAGATHDDLITWLAYKEAKALLQPPE